MQWTSTDVRPMAACPRRGLTGRQSPLQPGAIPCWKPSRYRILPYLSAIRNELTSERGGPPLLGHLRVFCSLFSFQHSETVCGRCLQGCRMLRLRMLKPKCAGPSSKTIAGVLLSTHIAVGTYHLPFHQALRGKPAPFRDSTRIEKTPWHFSQICPP